jgi:hypothetical protein
MRAASIFVRMPPRENSEAGPPAIASMAGLARVEVAAALLGVVQGQQHLTGNDVVALQRLGPRAGQGNLAYRGGGLTVLEFQRRLRQPQQRPPERDRPGGDDQHVGAALVQRGDVVDQRAEPLPLQRPRLAVDQQRRADFHYDLVEPAQVGKIRHRLARVEF